MKRAMVSAAVAFRISRKVFKRGSREHRWPTAFLAAACLATALLAQPSRAAVPSAQDHLALQALLTCYAYSFDAIARATLALGNVALDSLENFDNDPRWAEGAERFLDCTTDDFSINILFNGNFAGRLEGALPWLNFVSNGARAAGQRNTQHQMGTFHATVRRRPAGRTPQRGTITAYSIIRTMYLPDAARAGNIDLSTATYTITARKVSGQWKIAAVELNLTSSSTELGTPPLDSPPPPAQ